VCIYSLPQNIAHRSPEQFNERSDQSIPGYTPPRLEKLTSFLEEIITQKNGIQKGQQGE
jgi:hypothetical protein